VPDTALRVGFAGLGLMGRPMARNLATAGLLQGVYNRTLPRADDFAEETGVDSCASPSELARSANVLITMLADGDVSWDVFAGPGGLLETIRPGSIAIQMSTVGVDHIRELGELVEARGCFLLDVPVSGSISMAEDATLTLMAGGPEACVRRVEPVLRALGSHLFHLGPLGSGAAMKLAVNAIVYGLNEALAEGLVLAERVGIPRERAYEVIAASAAAAPFVHYRRTAFEHPDTAPLGLRLQLAAKDLKLILGLAAELQQSLPQTELNAEIIARAVEAGYADADVALVAEFLRRDGRKLAASRKASS
jgi:3-hydroxyisobutyrate dehydrogenase-like beta-hydroxyacid dehydrogenase